MRNLGKLKMYHLKRQEKQKKETPDSSTLFLGAFASNQRSKANIFVTEHLPKAFYKQKKLLLLAFREARKAGKTLSGPAVRNGNYCLFVDDVQVRVVSEPTSSGPNPARTRKQIWSPNHARKNPKVVLGQKNLAMLPSYFDYIFVYLKQKAHLRPDLSPKFLWTSDPNPARTRTRPENPGPIYNSGPSICLI